MLGAGSTDLTVAYPNTCASIGAARVLRSVIILKSSGNEVSEVERPASGVDEGARAKMATPDLQDPLPLHLELVAGTSERVAHTGTMNVTNTSTEYGFLSARRRGVHRVF